VSTLEKTSLEAHVDLCQLRYQQLEDRLSQVEKQIKDINIDLIDMRDKMATNHAELKQLILQGNSEKFKAITAAAGAVVVSLLTALGYLITHLK
jgi:uncharacterized coiled-coil protein SlyX